jgi:hypothetical protein
MGSSVKVTRGTSSAPYATSRAAGHLPLTPDVSHADKIEQHGKATL